MASASNIVINDGAVTPVPHTFVPAQTPADRARFEDKSAGLYIGYNLVEMSLTRPSENTNGSPRKANGNLRLKLSVTTPKLEVVSNSTVSGIAPAPQVAYTPKVEVIYTLPERCSLQDRKDLHALLKNLLAHVVSTTAVENFELPF